MSYITDYTEPVDYFLRGEEYSAQVDDFIKHLSENTLDSINSIDLACVTDRVVEALIADCGEAQGYGQSNYWRQSVFWRGSFI